MKKLWLAVFLSIVIVCSSGFAAPIPFTIEKGFLIVPAKIKKDVSVEVVLATGAEYSILNSDVINKYKLPLSYTADGVVTGSNDRIITFSEVQNVTIGDAKGANLFMRFVTLDATSKKIGREIFGILGADFFKGKIVQFDFRKRTVDFLDQSPADTKNVKTQLSDGKSMILKMDFSQKTFYGAEIMLPVVEEIFYNGNKIRTLFDTGVAAPLSISPAVFKDAGFDSAPDKDATKTAQIKSLKFSSYEVSDVPAILFGKNTGFDRNSREYGAIVGLGVLQNFLLTLDYKNKTITLGL